MHDIIDDNGEPGRNFSLARQRTANPNGSYDGTRIPIIAVSPYAKTGFVDHTYYDHASILKFIERNWGVKPLSPRSRDNLSNPVQPPGQYAPINGPAIGDLWNLFNFGRFRPNAPKITPIVSDNDKGDHG
jgi:phospholipase C